MYKAKNILQRSSIIILALLAVISVANGQENQIDSRNGAYYYQGKKYEISELGPVIYDKPKAFISYAEGNKKYTSAKTLGVVGGAGIGLGLVFYTLKEEPKKSLGGVITEVSNVFFQTIGTLFIGTGVICGVTALVKRDAGLKFMKKGIATFNSKNNSMGYRPSLHIGLTNNGAGLVLSF